MAGILRTDSIIADSTASSSPPHPTTDSVADASAFIEPLVPLKRVSRTYGRPKVDIDTGDVNHDDSGSRARILKTAPHDADDQVIPESDDVDERGSSYAAFSWKAKLQAIDDEFDNFGGTDTTKRATNVSSVTHNDASDLSQNVEQSLQPSAASPLSGLSHLSLAGPHQQADNNTPSTTVGGDSLFSGSRRTLLSSDQSSSSSPFSRSHNSLLSSDGRKEPRTLSKRPRPLHKRVLQSPEVSDSESTSPQHPYAIDSPKNRSSPTPPTSPFVEGFAPNETNMSDEESANDVSRVSRSEGKAKEKGKGKAKRMKGPTKKDVLEIQKESARLLADQHVSIRRTQTQPVHTVANLFNKLKNAPMTVTKQDSDPITSFSSPGHSFKAPEHVILSDTVSPVKLHIADSTRPTVTAPHSSPQTTGKYIRDDDSDEDMPDPDALLRDQNEKRRRMAHEQAERLEAERRVKELQDRKRKALEASKTYSSVKGTTSRAGAKARGGSDSDDDLEIVEDMVSLPTPPRGHMDKDMKPLVGRHLTTTRVEKSNSSAPKTVSQRSLELAARPMFMVVQDKKGPQRKTGQGPSVSHRDLNQLLLQRADKQGGVIEEKKKEQWVKAGGSLKGEQHLNAPEKSVTDWLHQGSTREDVMEVDEFDEADDDEDPEYTPEDVEGDAVGRSDYEESETGVPDDESLVEQGMEISEDEPTADADKENHRPAMRRQTARVIVDSDEDDDVVGHAGPSRPRPLILAPDTSIADDGMGSPGEDKENSAELAFDLSEDKENARVPRHLPRGRVFSTSPSPDLHVSDGPQARREPLGRLDVEGESAFMPSLAQRRDSSQGRVLQVLHEEDKHSTLSPLSSAKKGFLRGTPPLSSPEPGDEHAESPKPFFNGVFSQLFAENENGDGEEPGPTTAIGGGFSQFFSPSGINRKSPLNNKDQSPSVHLPGLAPKDGEFQFTQPNTLLPSVRISESQRREVDEMFGKDQEFKMDEAKRSRENARSEEASVPGFLDFRPFATSQPRELSPHSIRRPLETLSLGSSDAGKHLDQDHEDGPVRRGRLLRERPRESQSSPSPSPAPRNAFDVLRDAAAKSRGKERAPRQRLDKSDFVEAEAQESDEEAMIGFGGAKGDDDEDLGDEDPNAVVEGLVDDAAMDATAQAADLVLEKHMEHQAIDDAALLKLHQDATAGKLRGKRRDRGLGFDDSDSEDDKYMGPRKPSYKKRRIEGDTLESYGENPETKAFYDAYQAELAEDADPRLAHLQQKESELQEEEGDSDAGEEVPETVDSAEVRRRVRELSKREISIEPEEQNLEDFSWMENEDEGVDDDYVVEERPLHLKKSAAESRSSLDQLDHRGTFKGKKLGTAEQVQLKSWASQEARAYSSASGRGGFSRKEEGNTSGSRKQNKIPMTSKASAARGEARAITKNSSLMSRVEKRKGFDV